MVLKKIFAATLSIITLSIIINGMTANAYSATRTIDNDAITSGYGNQNNGFSYITADYLDVKLDDEDEFHTIIRIPEPEKPKTLPRTGK